MGTLPEYGASIWPLYNSKYYVVTSIGLLYSSTVWSTAKRQHWPTLQQYRVQYYSLVTRANGQHWPTVLCRTPVLSGHYVAKCQSALLFSLQPAVSAHCSHPYSTVLAHSTHLTKNKLYTAWIRPHLCSFFLFSKAESSSFIIVDLFPFMGSTWPKHLLLLVSVLVHHYQNLTNSLTYTNNQTPLILINGFGLNLSNANQDFLFLMIGIFTRVGLNHEATVKGENNMEIWIIIIVLSLWVMLDCLNSPFFWSWFSFWSSFQLVQIIITYFGINLEWVHLSCPATFCSKFKNRLTKDDQDVEFHESIFLLQWIHYNSDLEQ